MEPSHLLLVQTLSLSGLVGATSAFAGIVRRRQRKRFDLQAMAGASDAAVDRLDRSAALSRLRRTFSPSAYPRHDSTSATPADRMR